jgi:dipeptidyl aminopeptidase/acylaminoacyl peptidase
MRAPYGSWRSPLRPEHLIAALPPSAPDPADDGLYWLELRPEEEGRTTLLFAPDGGEARELTPHPFNVRSRVHEYGGAPVWRDGSTIWFSNFADARMYRIDGGGTDPRPVTPESSRPIGLRYADGIVRDGNVICVRESHETDEVVNELVIFPGDGSSEPRVLASGRDFYSSPRLSPDGSQLAFLGWDHPLLPFFGCDLGVADFDGAELGNVRRVTGGQRESVCQPEWSADGVLYFCTDRSGWWNLHRLAGEELENLTPLDAEVGYPHWQFGLTRYAFLGDGRVALVITRNGIDSLALLDPGTRELDPVELPFVSYSPPLRARGDRIVFVAATETESAGMYELNAATRELSTHVEPQRVLDAEWVSRAQRIEFPGHGGAPTHAFYYPPTNPEFDAPADELPPLRVLSHGGPTAHRGSDFALGFQYWTSRGFAIVEVNYGGSTGHGREYRERLNGNWGVVDVDDCVAAARYLIDAGRADPSRVVIEGGSAGGYTTLCALVFTDAFAVGVNHFGVTDLETFVHDTHKFEARYLDLLVGPYPERKDLYEERSPVNHFDRLSCPVLTFQGLDDRVVPPSQSEQLVEALRRKGLPYAYLAFEGEGHGFRKRESLLRVPEATLYFLSRIFGFEPADELERIPIENLD